MRGKLFLLPALCLRPPPYHLLMAFHVFCFALLFPFSVFFFRSPRVLCSHGFAIVMSYSIYFHLFLPLLLELSTNMRFSPPHPALLL